MPTLQHLRPLRVFAAAVILAACDTPLSHAPVAPALEGIPAAPATELTPAAGPILTLTASAETLRVKSRLPYWIAVTARVESAGILLSDSAAVTLSDPAAAKVWFAAVKRRTEIFNADSTRPSGRVFVRGTWRTLRDSVALFIETPATIAPAPAPGPSPSGAIVQVDLGTRFQRIWGWQAQVNDGVNGCNAVAYPRFRDQVHDRAANELGINNLRLEIRSGSENNRNYFAEWKAGLISDSVYRASWFTPINDNADPFVADLSRFHFGFLDQMIDNVVTPMRARLAARGEVLRVTLTMVDFLQGRTLAQRPFNIAKAPEEYAELITVTFRHIQQKYGWTPDAVELTLEPEHSATFPLDLGRMAVAADARLRAAGFAPLIISPATTSMANGHQYHDQMLSLVPASRGVVDLLSYHRYVAVSDASLATIGAITRRDGIMSGMLEFIGGGIDELLADLTVGQVSAWQRFNLAFCENRDNPDNQGVYYQVNQSDPANPRVNITNGSKLLRQVFAYVREGAVRVGAVSGDAALKPVAFVNRSGAAVVVVRTASARTFTVRGLPPGTYAITHALDGGAYNVSRPTITKGGASDVVLDIPGKGAITIAGVGS
jgi:hypothetical protein